jgi:hypothetical protein
VDYSRDPTRNTNPTWNTNFKTIGLALPYRTDVQTRVPYPALGKVADWTTGIRPNLYKSQSYFQGATWHIWGNCSNFSSHAPNLVYIPGVGTLGMSMYAGVNLKANVAYNTSDVGGLGFDGADPGALPNTGSSIFEMVATQNTDNINFYVCFYNNGRAVRTDTWAFNRRLWNHCSNSNDLALYTGTGFGGPEDYTLFAVNTWNRCLGPAEVQMLLMNPLQMYNFSPMGGYVFETLMDPPGVGIVPNPAVIQPGQSSVLTYTSTNATTLTIDQGIGVVPGPNGTVTVSPLVNTTYTITATNFVGTAVAWAHVTVQVGPTPPPPPPAPPDPPPIPPPDPPPPVYPGGYIRLYRKDCELRVKQWGSSGPYQVVRPFGGDSFETGAKI